MTAVLKALLLPPGGLILAALVGLCLCGKRRRFGRTISGAALTLLYLLSTPIVAGYLIGSLMPPYVDPLTHRNVQAIVVLGGGTVGKVPEYGKDSVTQLTLARVRYGARLQRLTGKPMLVSGGVVRGPTSPEAEQMRAILVDEFQVPVEWLESASTDTFTNAVESARILTPHGIKTIYLVTHAWHIPRARLAFEAAGFDVVPAPTGFPSVEQDEGLSILDFLPRASALLNSYYFCHEVIGYAAYWLRARL